jgi:hypothetical protein
VVILLMLACLHPSRYTRGSDMYWVFAVYVAAKVVEFFDVEILAIGNLVSGHTLKHLVAAAAGLVVCRMLLLRVPITPDAVQAAQGLPRNPQSAHRRAS